jgi:hypothetical protein
LIGKIGFRAPCSWRQNADIRPPFWRIHLRVPRHAARIASRRQADVPKAPLWGAQTVVGFENLIQPILDKKCVKCHSGAKAWGTIDLSRGKAYQTIVRARKLLLVSNRRSGGGVTSVKQFGSHKSKLSCRTKTTRVTRICVFQKTNGSRLLPGSTQMLLISI